MNPETRLKTVAEVVGLCVIVLIVGLLVGRSLSKNSGTYGTGQSATTTNNSASSTTATDVPAGTTVPNAGDKVSGDIAVPSSVVEAAPGVQAKSRSFDVTVSGDKFTPSTVVVNAGDTTSIHFTALDKDYDFTQPDMGLSAKLLKGKSQLIQVSPAISGKFTYFCSSCGGPAKGPVGYIVVVPK